MPEAHTPSVRCTVSVRVPVDGGYRFDPMDHPTTQRGSTWEVAFPPQIGDLLFLNAGTFRVVDRMWVFNEYGSANWPHGHQDQLVGTSLNLIVETAEGMYVNEAPAPTSED